MTTSLTSEQQSVLNASRRGLHRLKVEALAGTGKTFTLVELAKDLKVRRSSQRTLYVAFNRFVVEDVSVRIGRFADAMTVNSLALRMVGREYQEKLLETPQRMSHLQVANLLGITDDIVFDVEFDHPAGVSGHKNIRIPRERVAGMVGRAVLHFCSSLDRELDTSYFDDTVWLGPTVGSVPVPQTVKLHLLEYTLDYWSDIADLRSRRFRFRHEHYMKLWHLSDPIIPYDTILFDEAQDADPLMREVVERHDGDVVWCGDRFQAIYGWRGAVNAMQEVEADETLFLTKSFRFASGVAEVANMFLEPLGSRLVEGAASHASVVTDVTNPDVEIFRKNASLIERFMDLTSESVAVRTDVDLGEYERAVVALLELRRGNMPRHPVLVEFESFQALNDWLKDPDMEEDDFRVMVRQLLRHDLDDLLAALVKARESHSFTRGRLLTTAHKVKGLGFDRVVVADDFPAFSHRDPRMNPRTLVVGPTERPDSLVTSGTYIPVDVEGRSGTTWWLCPPIEEWNLAYVAVTRAQRELVHPFVEVLNDGEVRRALQYQKSSSSSIVEESDFTAGVPRQSMSNGLFHSVSPDVVVAGTSYCQENLLEVTKGLHREQNGWRVSAIVRREQNNEFDANAVVVTIAGHKVGYVPKELAVTVGQLLGSSSFEMPAIVVGGYVHHGSRATLGVRLHLGWGSTERVG